MRSSLKKAAFLAEQVPHAPGVLPRLQLPFLDGVPAVQKVFEQQPIAISAILLVFISHFVLFNTRWGLRTRAVGEHPRAADTVGINVYKMRYWNVIIGGLLAGLAGAYFTIESVPSFEPLMTNGRGFHFAGCSHLRELDPDWSLGCRTGVWSFTSIANQLCSISVMLSHPNGHSLTKSYIVGMVPYVLTMIILTGLIGKTTAPAADGEPYEK